MAESALENVSVGATEPAGATELALEVTLLFQLLPKDGVTIDDDLVLKEFRAVVKTSEDEIVA